MPDSENPNDLLSVDRATFAELVDALARLIEALEFTHYKCELEDGQSCYAEQYGDGTAEEHAEIMNLRALNARTSSAA